MGKAKDHTGKVFGRLTAVSRAENKGKKTAWLCSCVCGNTLTVTASSLSTGHTKSCGCLVTDTVTKHGEGGSNRNTRTKLYQVWATMVSRCRWKAGPVFHHYGGRGITVCDAWRDFKAFRSWAIQNGYKEGLQIDRINNDAGYQPENCRWVPQQVNAQNKRVTKLSAAKVKAIRISHQAKIMTRKEMADFFGVCGETIRQVVCRETWSNV